ncbi:MAG: type II toxin-antitoxin system Phd/YefM family antitoxin, partial [Angustibacter sp.]
GGQVRGGSISVPWLWPEDHGPERGRRQPNRPDGPRVFALSSLSGPSSGEFQQCGQALARAYIQSYLRRMQTLSIFAAKDRPRELVEQSVATGEQFIITRKGAPAAVLVGADDWESIQETLVWLAQEGIREDVARSQAEVKGGLVFTQEQVRQFFAGRNLAR